jgi:hypothetical protein
MVPIEHCQKHCESTPVLSNFITQCGLNLARLGTNLPNELCEYHRVLIKGNDSYELFLKNARNMSFE